MLAQPCHRDWLRPMLRFRVHFAELLHYGDGTDHLPGTTEDRRDHTSVAHGERYNFDLMYITAYNCSIARSISTVYNL